ncbi:hypothetical protein Gdia_2457 [Gluconacetobacter diazotrophicus PA1 5]|uniref:hypothetical protein n=1 Tax=Gluconacetobacter diazotrophicus TaxID=33996 RepID=UPI000173D81F|nr:hypothetical protein [Gluconacetobacter diazotrophicus]ACI52202.1 hypothetical protein Gdia_2457 [Gluconacetobacter diazotrophicus PA1 5]TWB00431.1 hypothetical protein FBZ86_13611 [Gluconacetobacter diazotrophicus]
MALKTTKFPNGVDVGAGLEQNGSPLSIPTQQPAVPELTDNSGGTSQGDALEAVPVATAAATDTSAALLTSVNTALTAVKNDLSTLAAAVNGINAALTAAGILE